MDPQKKLSVIDLQKKLNSRIASTKITSDRSSKLRVPATVGGRWSSTKSKSVVRSDLNNDQNSDQHNDQNYDQHNDQNYNQNNDQHNNISFTCATGATAASSPRGSSKLILSKMKAMLPFWGKLQWTGSPCQGHLFSLVMIWWCWLWWLSWRPALQFQWQQQWFGRASV